MFCHQAASFGTLYSLPPKKLFICMQCRQSTPLLQLSVFKLKIKKCSNSTETVSMDIKMRIALILLLSDERLSTSTRSSSVDSGVSSAEFEVVILDSFSDISVK